MPHFEHKRSPDAYRLPEDPQLDVAYTRARELIKKEGISPERFRGLYDSRAIDRDLEYVKRREAEIKMRETPRSAEHAKLATILEAIINEYIEKGWLGPNADTIRASRFDDLANGVDTIIRFRREGEGDTHLGMAVDITYARDIEPKMALIKEEIRAGKLAEIKYFIADEGEPGIPPSFMGRLPVPRVVIGAEGKTARKLAEIWMDEKRSNQLAHHYVEILIIEELRDQVRTFEAYARKYNQKHIALAYRKVGAVLERSLQEKQKKMKEGESLPTRNDMRNQDAVFDAISEYLQSTRTYEIKEP